MAVHIDKETSLGNAPKQKIEQNLASSIGFDNNDIFMMSSSIGASYTLDIGRLLIEAYKNLPVQEKPRVSILDKQVVNQLAWSAVIVSKKNKITSSVNYYIILLEATGRMPLKAADIMAEISAAGRINQRPNIYTTDDAIDSVLHEEVLNALSKEYDNGCTFQSVDGLIVPTTHGDVTELVANIAPLAFNACAIDELLGNGDKKDLNLAEARARNGASMLRLDASITTGTTKNEVGAPIRADWKVELNSIDTTNAVQSLNLQNNKNTLLMCGGFIDAIPEEVALPTMPGHPMTTNVRLHPHIVITSNSVKRPTTGYMLLGLISSLVMTNVNMWLATCLPKDTKNNIGGLNIMTNLEGNTNKIGANLSADLAGKKYKNEEVYGVIKSMFTLDPIVSMDIESFGPQTFYKSILSLAAQPKNNVVKTHAANELIRTANWLTNGNFPADFPALEIFANEGVIVPTGIWHDKTGERDIRDIDLAFIAAHSNGDVSMMNRWVLSNLPREATGLDPYLTKIDIIAKIIPEAEITGKVIRVTFTAKFINSLVNSATAAGLDARYEPAIQLAENNTISIMSNYLAHAGIQNASGFARQNINTGPVFNTAYSGMGYGRYI